MSAPSMRICPLVGSISRLTILRVVVLPHPDGPTRTQMRPAGTASDRSFTAPGVFFSRAPYTFVTWRNSTVAPGRWPAVRIVGWAVVRSPRAGASVRGFGRGRDCASGADEQHVPGDLEALL